MTHLDAPRTDYRSFVHMLISFHALLKLQLGTSILTTRISAIHIRFYWLAWLVYSNAAQDSCEIAGSNSVRYASRISRATDTDPVYVGSY